MTELQQTMIRSSLRAPRAGMYVVQAVCGSGTNLDTDLLRRAWHLVARRHAALRTFIQIDADGDAHLSVLPDADPVWRELDWTAVEPADWPNALAAWLRDDRQQGFGFGPEIPSRITLPRGRDGIRTILWTMHHALVDGGSMRNVLAEWFAFYDRLAAGEVILPASVEECSDQPHQRAEQDESEARRYWQERLSGVSFAGGFIADRLHAQSNQDEGLARQTVSLPPELHQELRHVASAGHVTMHTLIQGAWAVLLSRYSGQSDVVFGVVRNGRRSIRAGAASVGMFINTLPLRVAVRTDAQLLPWLKELRGWWDSLRPFEHTPASRISEWCGLPAAVPLFDTMLAYDRESTEDSLRGALRSWEHRTVTHQQRTESALTLVAYGRPTLVLELVYDPRVLSARTIRAMAGHLCALLADFAARPECRVGDLNMLDAGEQRQFQAWNGTAMAFPSERCSHQLFEQQADRIPDHAAIEHPGGSLSYGELNRRTNRLARLLRRKGARPDDRIAIVMSRSAEAIVAVLAIQKAGAAFLPLSPDLPADRLASVLEDAQPRLVLCREIDRPRIHESMGEVLALEQAEIEAAAESGENLSPAAGPENAAYVICTSGSTGTPKAIVVNHRSLVNYTVSAGRIFGLSERDRRLQFASLTGDLFVAEVFNYLSAGATLVSCLDPLGSSLRQFVRLLDEHRITVTGIPSSWWHEWVAGMSDGAFGVPESLRVVIVGMERVLPSTWTTWRRLVGPRVRLFNAYGPAEATCTATMYEGGSSEWENAEFVPIGKPLPNVTAYVLDRGGTRLPVGVAGELYIGGEGVARGYLHAPDVTADRFRPDSFSDSPDGRVYRTGDLAFFLPDGNLVFAGRVDRQVKIRGFRVELDEIEVVLATHPAVVQCAVVVQDDADRPRLVAYFTSDAAQPPAGDDLRAHLARRLPDYMMPAAFVRLTRLPLTSNGKVDRRSLPPYVPGEADSTRTLLPPSTATEQRLCGLWKEVLRLEQVSVTDNFFELGGDSIAATRLITLIHSALGQEVPFALLLRAPTIALLASALDSGNTAGPFAPALVSIQPAGSRAVFYCVHGSGAMRGLGRHLGVDQPLLGIPRLEPVELAGRSSLEDTASRYVAMLRTFQPQGPYVLGGCCYAGVLAYEMARQLREAGESVPLLVLFDAVNPATSGFASARTIAAMLRYHAGAVRSLPARGAWTYVRDRLSTAAAQVRRRVRRAATRTAAAAPVEPAVGRAYVEAIGFDRYRPKPYGGRTVLCRGEWAKPYMDSTFGWGELVGANLDVIRLPVGHLEMLEEPAVETLGRELDARLRSL